MSFSQQITCVKWNQHQQTSVSNLCDADNMHQLQP